MNKDLVTLCLLFLAHAAIVTAADQSEAAPLNLGQSAIAEQAFYDRAEHDFMADGNDRWSDLSDLAQGDYLCPPKGKTNGSHRPIGGWGRT